MKAFWQWLIYSSANAENYSLSVKGLSTFIPTLIVFLNLIHVRVEPGSITQLLDGIAALIVGIGAAISAVVSVYGIIRKIWTTAAGTNDVIVSGIRK